MGLGWSTLGWVNLAIALPGISLVGTDIVSYYRSKWNPANTSNSTPLIAYHIDEDELEDGTADVPSNWNRAVFFKRKLDTANEIGLQRTHQDETSEDIYECICIDFSALECKKIKKEIRRIALLNLSDDLHSWLDFGDENPTGPNHRKISTFDIMYSKAGIGF